MIKKLGFILPLLVPSTFISESSIQETRPASREASLSLEDRVNSFIGSVGKDVSRGLTPDKPFKLANEYLAESGFREARKFYLETIQYFPKSDQAKLAALGLMAVGVSILAQEITVIDQNKESYSSALRSQSLNGIDEHLNKSMLEAGADELVRATNAFSSSLRDLYVDFKVVDALKLLEGSNRFGIYLKLGELMRASGATVMPEFVTLKLLAGEVQGIAPSEKLDKLGPDGLKIADLGTDLLRRITEEFKNDPYNKLYRDAQKLLEGN